MGYILNEDDTFTKVGHKKNKMQNKQKYIDLDEIKYYVPRIKYNYYHYYSSENLLVSTKIGKDSLLYKNCIKN